MKLTPDRLNSWLNEHHFSVPPVEYDLAASTGPVWTFNELLALDDTAAERERLLDLDVSYAHSAGGHELRQALAEHAGVEPEQVVVTTGGAEALWILFLLAAAADANVVVPQRPSFPTFNEAPPALGVEVRNYHMRREDEYAVDVDEIRALVDRRTTLIVVNRPHNPTGAVLPDEVLEEIHELALERQVTLLVDEVFHPIYHGDAPASAARLPGATVVGDLSKALCMSGLRIGWIVARDPRLLADYEQARSYFTVSSSPLSEALAAIALRNADAIYERAQTVSATNLGLLDEFFAAHPEHFAWVRPKGGMTAFPWLVSGTDSRDFCRRAVAEGVLLAPGDCFDAPAHFRVGYGAAGERLGEALERLAQVVERDPQVL